MSLIDNLRNRDYMSGVERERSRIKSTGEIFTPTELVQEILDQLPQELFKDPTKTFLDPTCGDGQFLSEVIIKKVENGSTYEQALATTYGVDLMIDNCLECIKRLYQVTEDQIEIIDKDLPLGYDVPGVKAIFKIDNKIINIVCADGLVYDYSFGENKITEWFE